MICGGVDLFGNAAGRDPGLLSRAQCQVRRLTVVCTTPHSWEEFAKSHSLRRLIVS